MKNELELLVEKYNQIKLFLGFWKVWLRYDKNIMQSFWSHTIRALLVEMNCC